MRSQQIAGDDKFFDIFHLAVEYVEISYLKN